MRIRPHLLLAVLGAVALVAPVANAGTRCSDDPERCVKTTATFSRPVNRVVAGVASTPALTPRPTPSVGAPAAPASAQLVRKASAAPRKAASKPQRSAQRTTPAPTPGMGMLLKLSTGSGGDVSSVQGKPSETPAGQSWIL